MDKKIMISFLAVIVVIGGIFLWQDFTPVAKISLAGEKVKVYKTPECGCCTVYASYLSRSGVEMESQNISSAELAQMKEENGIPRNLSSCHTSFVAGYVVEGHIPLSVIEKLLAEKPDIKGIALPGMPSGTPGMPGPKTEEWIIYSIAKDGTIGEFTRI